MRWCSTCPATATTPPSRSFATTIAANSSCSLSVATAAAASPPARHRRCWSGRSSPRTCRALNLPALAPPARPVSVAAKDVKAPAPRALEALIPVWRRGDACGWPESRCSPSSPSRSPSSWPSRAIAARAATRWGRPSPLSRRSLPASRASVDHQAQAVHHHDRLSGGNGRRPDRPGRAAGHSHRHRRPGGHHHPHAEPIRRRGPGHDPAARHRRPDDHRHAPADDQQCPAGQPGRDGSRNAAASR